MSSDGRPDRADRDLPETGGSGAFKAGFVVLVGLSGGTMALQGGGSILAVALSVLGALLVGAALAWYLGRSLGGM